MVRQWDDSRMRIEAESRSGSLISIDGRLRGDLIEGAIQWAGYEGEIDLIRSPRPLVEVHPETYADAVGFYERGPGDVIELRARAWGELLYHELRTGRVRTLFPLGADRFFVGSGIYLPRPIEAEIRLVRDDDDAVTALTETLLDATWRWVRETDGWEEYARLRARAVAAGIPEYVLERALERILGSDPPEEPPR